MVKITTKTPRSGFDASGAQVGAPIIFKEKGVMLVAHVAEDFNDISDDSLPVAMVLTGTDEDGNAVTKAGIMDIITEGYTAKIEAVDPIVISITPAEKKAVKVTTAKVKGPDALNALRQEILDKGIMTAEEIDERIAYMNGPACRGAFPVELQERVMRSWKPLKEGEKITRPKTLFVDKYANIPEYKNISVVAVAINKALNGQATIFQGHASTGKSVAAGTVLWLLYKPRYGMCFDEKLTAGALFGERTTMPPAVSIFPEDMALKAIRLLNSGTPVYELSEEDQLLVAKWQRACAMSQVPQITIEDAPLTHALKINAGFIADELNHGNSNAVGALNPLFDGSKFIQSAAMGTIEIPQDFVFIGTQNAGSKYTATNELDAATKSRMGVIEFPFTESIEDILRAAVEEVTRDRLTDGYFKACDRFYVGLKKLIKNQVPVDSALNVRGMVSALNETASTWINGKPMTSLYNAIKTCVVASMGKDGEDASLHALVDECFMKY